MRDHEATRLKIRQCMNYAQDFKRTVVQCAEKKGTREARLRYGVCEANIKRWQRLQQTSKNINNFDGDEDLLDDMPLDQRLKQPMLATSEAATSASTLQSQSLSPTKLKVTRQKATPTPPPVTNEEVCLRWNSHHVNMQNSFPSLLLKEQYVDVTLVAEGKILKCHRMILSSCSPYFEEVLSGISPFQHPVLFMKDIPHWIIKSLLDFMYAGEVHIFQDKLQELLTVAEILKIKGLAGKKEDEKEKEKSREEEHPEPLRKDKKIAKEIKIKKEPGKKPLMKKPVEKEGILDPLDLLEPLYSEPTKEQKPKIRETKYVPKKTFPRKIKKRKFTDLHEDSPPPNMTKKGTRSRPNIKVPKFYHPLYESLNKAENLEPNEPLIERQPHIGVPITKDILIPPAEIKSEPIDFDSEVFEFQDNNVRFSEQEEEESMNQTEEDEEEPPHLEIPPPPLEEPNPEPEELHPEESTIEEMEPKLQIEDLTNFTILNVESVTPNETLRINGTPPEPETQSEREPPDCPDPKILLSEKI